MHYALNSTENMENFATLRSHLLDRLILLLAIALVPGIILSVARAWYIGWLPLFTFHIGFGISFGLLVLMRSYLSYGWRVGLCLGSIWLAMIMGVASLGPVADVKVLLVMLAFLAMLLLSELGAWLTIAAAAASFAGLGVVAVQGQLHFDLDYQAYASNPLSWAVTIYTLTVYSSIIAYLGLHMVHSLHQRSEALAEAERQLHQDIAERNRAEAAERELRERLEKIADNVPGMLYQYQLRPDGHSSFPYVSAGIRELCGISPEAVHADATLAFQTLHPDDYAQVIASIEESAKTMQPWQCEFRFNQPTGRTSWAIGHATPQQEADGSILWHGHIHDISAVRQTQEALYDAERFARATIDALSAHLCVLDENGTILAVNQAWRAFAQANPPVPNNYAEGSNYLAICDQATGKCVEEAQPFATGLRAVLRGEQNYFTLEYPCHCATEQRWFMAQVTRFPGNGPVRLVVTHENITARKQAEQQLRIFEYMVLATQDFMAFIDRDYVYRMVNTAYANRFAKPLSAIIGHPVAEIIGVEIYANTAKGYLDRCFAGEEMRYQAWFNFANNKQFLDVIYSPYRDIHQVVIGAVVSVRDMTAQQQAEAELIHAREAAEADNRAKSAFLANMSHELRTPLNAVLGFAQILDKDPAIAKKQRSYVQSIQRGGEYLLTLINDILDLAKIEAGRFELFPEVWDTRSFFWELSEMFRIRATQKGLLFRYETLATLPYTLYCDNKRLRQIAMNLLSNAVKFTEQGEVILRTNFKTGWLCLEVADTGVGILPTEIDKIFEPFQQTGESKHKLQGTGLGLSISRRLVDAMEGQLTVVSTPGTGSTFRVEIPVEVVATPVEIPLQPDKFTVTSYYRTQGKGAFRVLITDDVANNRQVLRGLLEPLGLVVTEADSGQHCLKMVTTWQPDLILMDLRMPEMDGLETTRALRALPDFRDTPVVAISAAAFAQDREQSQAAGCNAHLAKPVSLDKLLDTLGQLLPLTWACAETNASETAQVDWRLSPEQAAQLIHFAKCGDIMAIKEFTEELEKNNCCPTLVRKIGVLAHSFEVEEILHLAQNL